MVHEIWSAGNGEDLLESCEGRLEAGSPWRELGLETWQAFIGIMPVLHTALAGDYQQGKSQVPILAAR